ncbi:hypothetical protein [Nannocystis punicea]|uniref:Uncharacterized protein n=1 Tax=Nannocystis punicea TaxID=2995304 RepID=A0ABY7HBM8_9BACT|nr:hypothetical protein [Nannocystis poenicansa]WAS96672.1 hypothetical protein O0S08_11020 [Nannocystis poenicansa]
MLMVLDRWLVQISAGLVVGVWLISDWARLPLSEGTKASLAAFVGYALLKSKSDNRWRALEMERDELHRLVERLESTSPGSPEALAVRRELVALARRVDSEGGDDA